MEEATSKTDYTSQIERMKYEIEDAMPQYQSRSYMPMTISNYLQRNYGE